MTTARRWRVVQWATGNIGSRALRAVIGDPRFDLVGVYVYDSGKVGTDAGDLCGEAPVGVVATDDRDAILSANPDCVLYMPRALDVDDLVAMLESGSNVVTTRGEMFAGGHNLDDRERARVLDACAAGSTSVYATGSSPGFITDALPFALLSMQTRVDLIEIDEFANMSRRDSPHMLFDLLGFGRRVDRFSPRYAEHLMREFAPPLAELARAAGRPTDAWHCTGEVAAARVDTELAAGPIAAGTVAAQRTVIVGSSAGDAVVRFVASWYCSTEVDPAWDLRPTGWRVRVHGDAPFDVALPFPVALDDLGGATPSYTANRPVNAIPYVCAAPPGLVSTSDLPPIVPGRFSPTPQG